MAIRREAVGKILTVEQVKHYGALRAMRPCDDADGEAIEALVLSHEALRAEVAALKAEVARLQKH